jgi:hypothetical protein
MAYLEKDMNGFHRTDHYLAQIALEIRRGLSKGGRKLSIKNFLLKFTRGKAPGASPTTAPAVSKSSWLGLLGVKRKKE